MFDGEMEKISESLRSTFFGIIINKYSMSYNGNLFSLIKVIYIIVATVSNFKNHNYFFNISFMQGISYNIDNDLIFDFVMGCKSD